MRRFILDSFISLLNKIEISFHIHNVTMLSHTRSILRKVTVMPQLISAHFRHTLLRDGFGISISLRGCGGGSIGSRFSLMKLSIETSHFFCLRAKKGIERVEMILESLFFLFLCCLCCLIIFIIISKQIIIIVVIIISPLFLWLLQFIQLFLNFSFLLNRIIQLFFSDLGLLLQPSGTFHFRTSFTTSRFLFLLPKRLKNTLNLGTGFRHTFPLGIFIHNTVQIISDRR
mmetsp:Transcript_12675/g.19579  ORF Transcript_12675/g.19579 Transcript_12675/m.19579 type:complete len:229 (+) Transcript_12675:3789-4475(+)